MKRMYQSDWHGISFNSFTPVSSRKLADADFYSRFYSVFFKKYKKLEDLDPSWVKLKMQMKEFLKQDSKFKKDSAILSIGCGLGFVEKALIEEGFSGLEVTEVSITPLKWLLPYISAGRVHVGFFPECLPAPRLYDLIYLAGVETFFTQPELINFLKAVNERLLPGGRCLIISWSFRPGDFMSRAAADIKDWIRFLLHITGLRKRGQFWGYIRSRKELYNAVASAGLINIRDGFFEKKTRWGTYWIAADKKNEPC